MLFVMDTTQGTACAADAEPFPPAGFVDRAEACRVLGITRRAMTHWITDGKLTCGVTVPHRRGGRCKIYPIEALKQLRAEMLGRDRLFKGGAGTFATPPGWARRHEACRMIGVDRPTWERWAEDGMLPEGKRFDDGPTMYRIEDLKAMLSRGGLLAPPYPDPERAGAYRVPLCGGNVRGAGGREAVIDEASLPLLDGAVLVLESLLGGQVAFVGLCTSDKPGGVALRRAIMGVADEGLKVGHVNGDPLDCRRENLVVKTIQQRTHGARKMKGMKGRPCSSRFKGVFWDEWAKKWRARIVHDGRTHQLGRFGNEVAAAEAYDEAAKKWFGAHAWLNFPDGIDAYLEREARESKMQRAA
jgi:hypothetical protein